MSLSTIDWGIVHFSFLHSFIAGISKILKFQLILIKKRAVVEFLLLIMPEIKPKFNPKYRKIEKNLMTSFC
jgi:hypothetical protein